MTATTAVELDELVRLYHALLLRTHDAVWVIPGIATLHAKFAHRLAMAIVYEKEPPGLVESFSSLESAANRAHAEHFVKERWRRLPYRWERVYSVDARDEWTEYFALAEELRSYKKVSTRVNWIRLDALMGQKAYTLDDTRLIQVTERNTRVRTVGAIIAALSLLALLVRGCYYLASTAE